MAARVAPRGGAAPMAAPRLLGTEVQSQQPIEWAADKKPLIQTDDLASGASPRSGASSPTAAPGSPAWDLSLRTGEFREAVHRLFLGHKHRRFADDAELAVRAAFFVVVLGLPFLIPRGEHAVLDFLMKNGMYTRSVIIFYIFNLSKTAGDCILNIICGLRGTLLAVLNTWALYYFFPEGVTETSPAHVFWAGAADGVLFVLTMLWLNFQMPTTMFAVCTFIGWWMDFLKPGEDRFQSPFSEGFQFFGNKGISSLMTVCVGGLLVLMVTLIPYPLWAIDSARETATELIHQLPRIWQGLAEYFCEAKPNTYQADELQQKLVRLSKLVTTMEGQIATSWYESMFSWRRRQVRKVLNSLEKALHESYDRLFSTYSTARADHWSPAHAELMQRVRPTLFVAIRRAEALMQVCLESAFDGELTEEEEFAIRRSLQSLTDAEAAFTQAFKSARHDLMRRSDSASTCKECLEGLAPEHIFGLNFAGFVRLLRAFGEDLIQQRYDPDHFPPVTELPTISSLWDRSVVLERMHINWALRASMTLLTGFAVGYFGFSDVYSRYNADIAGTIAVLLSKFLGSAMVKNMNRIQGLVLGTVVGQIIHTFFESCAWWDVSALALAMFIYAACSLFIAYHSPQYSLVGVLLAAFGCGQMLKGGCSSHTVDKTSSYDTISNTLAAMALVVFYDALLSPGRASDHAHEALGEAVGLLESAVQHHFDPKVDHVRFHKGELFSAIAKAEAMGEEALQEPRYWRTEWPHEVFTKAIRIAYRIRYNLAAMEYCCAEDFQDGGRKSEVLRTLVATPSFNRVPTLLQAKLDSVRPLVGFFVHETEQQFGPLEDGDIFHEFRLENQEARRVCIADLSRNPMLHKAREGTLEEDSLSQVCMVLGSLDALLEGLRQFQHCVLRGE